MYVCLFGVALHFRAQLYTSYYSAYSTHTHMYVCLVRTPIKVLIDLYISIRRPVHSPNHLHFIQTIGLIPDTKDVGDGKLHHLSAVAFRMVRTKPQHGHFAFQLPNQQIPARLSPCSCEPAGGSRQRKEDKFRCRPPPLQLSRPHHFTSFSSQKLQGHVVG